MNNDTELETIKRLIRKLGLIPNGAKTAMPTDWNNYDLSLEQLTAIFKALLEEVQGKQEPTGYISADNIRRWKDNQSEMSAIMTNSKTEHSKQPLYAGHPPIEVQGKQDSVGWQFYQEDAWHNGTTHLNHKQNTIDAGYPVRELYAGHPPNAQAEIDTSQKVIDGLNAEVKHWKTNHANEVERARLIKNRPDLSLERANAYDRCALDKVEALQAQLKVAVDALERVGSSEAFDFSRALHEGKDAELLARMKYARDKVATIQKEGKG